LTPPPPPPPYTPALHDALPISGATPCASASRKPPATARLYPAAMLRKSRRRLSEYCHRVQLMITPLRIAPSQVGDHELDAVAILDRKSTRLNSSHEWISYAVFC